MDQNLFSNDFKSVELCKQMQKKCSIESDNFNQSSKNVTQINFYDEEEDDEESDENGTYSVDEYDEQKYENDSNESSRLPFSYLKKSAYTLTELNPFIKNKHSTEQIGLDNLPLTPAGKFDFSFSRFFLTLLIFAFIHHSI